MSTRPYKYVTVETTNQITTVTLNRPDKKNAMSFELIRELIKVSKKIKADKSVRAVILTGSGDDFCAGIDLGSLNDPKNRTFAMWELIKPYQNMFQKVNLCWRELPVPVIASIHGHCIGAGLQLVMGCDVRISSSNGKFSIMEAKWGLVPDMGLTQSAFGSVNIDVLKELAMTARVIEAQEAKEVGLITHVDDAPLEKAMLLAEELKTRSPDAVLASKRVVNRMFKQPATTLYQEKVWQMKLMLGKNQKLAVKKAKDSSIEFLKRQFK
ncbi:crotonase/enoyl-CoA hydratase family protein [Psychrobacter sp. HD31]|uniref:crotonase/enoyl-CoA hydratase family protein n=1 Tax=Psychrobacter sp. HD31 TaxID=3112003 RepID=UPI003DA44DEA